MQIHVNEYFFQFGKKSKSLPPENIDTKSMDIVRDDKGAVIGAIPTYSLGSKDKYVDLVFQNNHRLQNLVFIYENIPEIQFPFNYLTSRIKNGNFVVKRWDDKRGRETGDWSLGVNA
jgi:predicted PolB exonuclease-like 3'-5' exonuclease